MHCRFYISGLSCYCLKILIILRHSLLRCIILVCYYFYFFFVRLICQRGKFYIYMENACSLPFVLRKNETKKKNFYYFFLYCDMLLCKRFRQKFTIYFIMISDKKNCDMYCTILVNIFCIEVWKIGTESSLFFYIL